MKTSGGKSLRVRSSRSYVIRRSNTTKLSKEEMRKIGEEAVKSHPIHVIPTSYLDATKIIDNLKKSMLHVPVSTGDVVGHFFTNEDGTAGSRHEKQK